MTKEVPSGPLETTAKLWADTWPDRELVASGVEDGIPWAIGPGGLYGLCGYAIVPAEGHPWSMRWPNDIDAERDREEARQRLARFADLDYDFDEFIKEEVDDSLVTRAYLDDYLSAHGGITWYHHPFVGFDTMHSGDVWDGTRWEEQPIPGIGMRSTDIAKNSPWSRQWSLEQVIEETKKLARQVAEVRNLENLLEREISVKVADEVD